MEGSDAPLEAQANAPSSDVLADAVATLTLDATSVADESASTPTDALLPTPWRGIPFDGVNDALPVFSTIEDLGVFIWSPRAPSNADLKSHGEATVGDIRDRTGLIEGVINPPVLDIPVVGRPIEFPRSPSQKVINRFPNDPGVAPALAAATARGLELGSVDFVFGGSTLNVLATRVLEGKVYLVQRVGQTIVIGKHSEYTSDLSERGFQFERFVTGQELRARANEESVVGMQLANVGEFKVFFHAEVDALDSSGKRVEVKSGNPRRFGAKEMFQMVSSRSSSLVSAEFNMSKLIGVKLRPLSYVAELVPWEKRLKMQDTLLETMAALKEMVAEISEDQPSQLKFTDDGSVKRVELLPRPDVALLPPRDVIAELISVPVLQ